MAKMWKILKGKGKKQVLDSTWTDLRKANNRLKALKASGDGRFKSVDVFLVEAEEDDPINFRRKVKGPYTNYQD